jgi:hypothetical protein
MIDVEAHRLHHFITSLSIMEAILSFRRWNNTGSAVQVSTYGAEGDFASDINNLIEMLESLEMPSSAASVRRVRTSYERQGTPGHTEQQLETVLTEFRHKVYDEIKQPLFIALVGVERKLYEPSTPLFGDSVDTKFPSLRREISEAGKCLALGRATASAFHSVRVLEAGIRAISRCLGIPDPTKGADRSWHNMLKAIETESRKRWPTAADRFSGDGKTFEELHGAFSAVQNPYRNATAHLDCDYDEDQARHLLEMSKGLFQRIAARMDERGSPLA